AKSGVRRDETPARDSGDVVAEVDATEKSGEKAGGRVDVAGDGAKPPALLLTGLKDWIEGIAGEKDDEDEGDEARSEAM
ncbi:hypothetical protein HK101_000917, partial [Irineochytrium annulatum]